MQEDKSAYYRQIEKIFLNISVTELSTNYKESLNKAIANDLWEYGVTIIWKSIILFFYEKLYQISLINNLHQDFINNLENVNRDRNSTFAFNCLQDDFIFQKMGYIWRNVDQNFKNSFRHLLDERNSLSHVNEYPYSEIKFRAYIEKSVELLDYLQDLHFYNIVDIIKEINSNRLFQNLSPKEIEIVIKQSNNNYKITLFLLSLIPVKQINDEQVQELKNNVFELFISAKSADDAFLYGKKLIEPLIPYFNEYDYSVLIESIILKNCRRILQAPNIEEIFLKLYSESINNYRSSNNLWLKLLEQINKTNTQDNFSQLIKLIKE